MGGTSSKPAPTFGTPMPVAPVRIVPDISKASYSGDYIEKLTKQAEEQAAAAAAAAAEEVARVQAQLQSSSSTIGWFKIGGYIVAAILGILILIAAYDAAACAISEKAHQILFAFPGKCNTPAPGPPAVGQELLIISATFGDNATPGQVTDTNKDVRDKIRGMIDSTNSIPAFMAGYSSVGLPSNPAKGVNYLSVQWRKAINTTVQTTTAAAGEQFGPITPDSIENFTTTAVNSPRPILQQWYFGSASGNLIPSMHDTKNTVNVSSTLAAPSSEGTGAYGIQWWMFVKDWNYKYGSEKMVLSRSDATNGSIYNPKVTLAPTENNLKVSVSIFPSELAGASKTEPAPANNYSATDDVFVCEVPNIPLQSWISVSVTVFDRNLDVYINGNLVKSCFLPGVPKPAVGNIDVSKDGGFSGYMCGLNHYGKALVPSDAQAFYAAGSSCVNQTGSAGPSGNYNVKFGVYDTKGKEVKEYTF